MDNKTPTDLSERLAYLQYLIPDISFEQVIIWVLEAE